MSERLDKTKVVKGQKWERMDPINNIGISTYSLIKDAIKEAKNDLARDLIDYVYFWEIKFVRDSNIDLVGGFPQFFMTNYGEDEFYEAYRETILRMRGLSSWPIPPIGKHDISPFHHAMRLALWNVRPQRMGRVDGTGGFTLEEYDDRWEVVWDPC